MIEILGIGIKLDVDNKEIELEKNKNTLNIKDKISISSQAYDIYNKNWKCRLFFNDKIKFISGHDIYLYDFDYLNQKDKIFSRSEIIYVGLNLKEEKEIDLIQDKYYILSPSSKIKIGKGKIGSDLKETIIDTENVIRNILRAIDGLLIRKIPKI
ncbi:MAG: hypothetical protein QW648_03735 [Nanoarchaeales archaeon]